MRPIGSYTRIGSTQFIISELRPPDRSLFGSRRTAWYSTVQSTLRGSTGQGPDYSHASTQIYIYVVDAALAVMAIYVIRTFDFGN